MDKSERKNDAKPLEIEKQTNEAQHEKGDMGIESLNEKGNMGNNDNSQKKDKKKRKKESTEDDPESRKDKKKKRKSKKVTFSDKVDVFPNSDKDKENTNTKTDNLLRGKWFTPEEDKILKESVLDYIKSHDLGGEEEALKKILNCRSHPELKNCWKQIGARIPYRPHSAIYYRAHILFEQGEKGKWTEEETEYLRKSYKKHRNDWKKVAEELGKNRIHVKDKWRRIKFDNKKGGRWSQEEYQGLYDLVNLDLQMKVISEEKKSKHGMLRDNIPWTAISEKLSTRNDSTCCKKWYSQLTSSLVEEGKWSNVDDYRLIRALYDLDASCVEDVEWDRVLEHRSGDVCRKRWEQMVRHIGHHGSKPFSEQVEILSQRYCPDLEEVREEWDSKPLV
ncbi:unnamed protein product [Lactuca saligna]|uniref:Uncharacterized protein n=1 Tax=Lactuca saligna TaxID=75948 RepID=A0AA35Z557_LACSI|nr:unnamed protein product [Lactuca saligna]